MFRAPTFKLLLLHHLPYLFFLQKKKINLNTIISVLLETRKGPKKKTETGYIISWLKVEAVLEFAKSG